MQGAPSASNALDAVNCDFLGYERSGRLRRGMISPASLAFARFTARRSLSVIAGFLGV
jgi:hypothetical protein